MELYKSRDFSSFFQDTFTFIKLCGGHYFKHLFVVTGFFILILMTLGYFMTKMYTGIFNSALSGANQGLVMDSYLNDNAGMFGLLIILFLTVGLLSGLILYAYSPIYLKLYNEHGGKNFGTNEIVNIYKSNIGKLFVFLISSLLISIPLIIVVGIIGMILAITIIGILLIPVLFGALMLFYGMTFMEYIEGDKGIFECYGYSWSLMTKKFWAAIGSVGLFFLMCYIGQTLISMIPYIFGMVSIFTTIEESGVNATTQVGSTMTTMMLIMFILNSMLSIFVGQLIEINQGIVFYGLKEENENIGSKSIIDQIGAGE
ncbi:hypothetical protein [Mangrovimonas aestuarii]|uniref:hypothetical protein n=1 Tax=Mangrovimonas aestuarii TaxID=3018443 RepID=UPI0023794141|nr:hypothetical protein [Mangrovimonas aestuarii]